MSNEDVLVYLKRQRERYQELVSRLEKSALITEVMNYLQVTRGHAIRCLGGKARLRQRKPGPAFRYTEDLLKHLKRLYFLMRRPCSKRMHAAMNIWIASYEQHVQDLSPEQKQKLLEISPASIDRLLSCTRSEHGLSTTHAPSSS